MDNIFDFFSKIYCINLDERKDKWIKVQKEFKKYNIIPERVSGIKYKGNEFDIRFKGAVGLSLTILNIIKNAKKEKLDNVLIFEDDVIFKKRDILNILKKAISELPKNWEIFTLGGNLQKKTIPYSQHLSKNVDSWGTQAWSINHIHYDTLINYIKSDKFKKEPRIDVILCKKINFGNYFIIKPLIATQEIGFSDINGTVNNTLLSEDINEKNRLI
jgi:GR25 family glycosyltransferase involved in LPS biosynthesis